MDDLMGKQRNSQKQSTLSIYFAEKGGRDLPAEPVEEIVEEFWEATEDEENDVGDYDDTEEEVGWLVVLEGEKHYEFYSSMSM